MNRAREPHLRMPPPPEAPAHTPSGMPPQHPIQQQQPPAAYPPQYAPPQPQQPPYDPQQQWGPQPQQPYGYYPAPEHPSQPVYQQYPITAQHVSTHNLMPPPPPPPSFDSNLDDPEPHAPRPSSWRVLLAIIGLVAIAGGSWFAYYWGPSHEGPPPLILAPEGPYKIKPESPGGAAVAYKDTLVYDRLAQHPHQSSGEQNVVILPDEPTMLTPEAETAPVQQEEQPMQSTPLSHMNQQPPVTPAAPVISNTPPVGLETPPQQVQALPQQAAPTTPVHTPDANQHTAVKAEKTAQQDMESMLAKLSDIQELPSSSKQVYFLQMATLKSEGDATSEMKRLKSKLRLQQSKWHVRKSETATGTLYALLLGPYKTKDEAKKRCDSIKNGCTVVTAE